VLGVGGVGRVGDLVVGEVRVRVGGCTGG